MHQPGCSAFHSIMPKQLQIEYHISKLGTFGPAQCKGVSMQREAQALGESFHHHDLINLPCQKLKWAGIFQLRQPLSVLLTFN